jgi:hypothetical protein
VKTILKLLVLASVIMIALLFVTSCVDGLLRLREMLPPVH